MESHLLGRSLEYHGPSLLRELEFEQQKVAPHIASYVQRHRPRSQEIDDPDFMHHVQRFIAAKADILFKPTTDQKSVPFNSLEEEDVFARMPPLETFMGVPEGDCLESFFNSIEKRDIVIGVVSSIMDAGMIITLLCLDNGISRDIDTLKVAAFCPSKELPKMFPNQNPVESYQVKDKIRGVVLSVNPENKKIIVSLLDNCLPEGQPHPTLGLIYEEDFPVQYRRKLHIRGLTFEELLNSILGFNNAGNVRCLQEILNLPDNTSLMRGLHQLHIPDKEFADSLRNHQSQKWAHGCVARGIAFFKEGKQVEAMQQLNKALQIDAINVEALVARGALYANNESYSRAIEDFEEALKNNPTHPNALKYMFETLLAKGKEHEESEQWDNALACYKQALKLQPMSDEAKESVRYIQYKKDFSERGSKRHPAEEREKERDDRAKSPGPFGGTAEKLKQLIQEDKDSKKRKRQSLEEPESGRGYSNKSPPRKHDRGDNSPDNLDSSMRRRKKYSSPSPSSSARSHSRQTGYQSPDDSDRKPRKYKGLPGLDSEDNNDETRLRGDEEGKFEQREKTSSEQRYRDKRKNDEYYYSDDDRRSRDIRSVSLDRQNMVKAMLATTSRKRQENSSLYRNISPTTHEAQSDWEEDDHLPRKGERRYDIETDQGSKSLRPDKRQRKRSRSRTSSVSSSGLYGSHSSRSRSPKRKGQSRRSLPTSADRESKQPRMSGFKEDSPESRRTVFIKAKDTGRPHHTDSLSPVSSKTGYPRDTYTHSREREMGYEQRTMKNIPFKKSSAHQDVCDSNNEEGGSSWNKERPVSKQSRSPGYERASKKRPERETFSPRSHSRQRSISSKRSISAKHSEDLNLSRSHADRRSRSSSSSSSSRSKSDSSSDSHSTERSRRRMSKSLKHSPVSDRRRGRSKERRDRRSKYNSHSNGSSESRSSSSKRSESPRAWTRTIVTSESKSKQGRSSSSLDKQDNPRRKSRFTSPRQSARADKKEKVLQQSSSPKHDKAVKLRKVIPSVTLAKSKWESPDRKESRWGEKQSFVELSSLVAERAAQINNLLKIKNVSSSLSSSPPPHRALKPCEIRAIQKAEKQGKRQKGESGQEEDERSPKSSSVYGKSNLDVFTDSPEHKKTKSLRKSEETGEVFSTDSKSAGREKINFSLKKKVGRLRSEWDNDSNSSGSSKEKMLHPKSASEIAYNQNKQKDSKMSGKFEGSQSSDSDDSSDSRENDHGRHRSRERRHSVGSHRQDHSSRSDRSYDRSSNRSQYRHSHDSEAYNSRRGHYHGHETWKTRGRGNGRGNGKGNGRGNGRGNRGRGRGYDRYNLPDVVESIHKKEQLFDAKHRVRDLSPVITRAKFVSLRDLENKKAKQQHRSPSSSSSSSSDSDRSPRHKSSTKSRPQSQRSETVSVSQGKQPGVTDKMSESGSVQKPDKSLHEMEDFLSKLKQEKKKKLISEGKVKEGP